jgi:hypothetical protein
MHPMSYDMKYQLQKDYQQDLLNLAEKERQIRTVRRRRSKNSSFNRRFFCWLGCRLITWGQNLLKGYEPLPGDLSTSELNLAK